MRRIIVFTTIVFVSLQQSFSQTNPRRLQATRTSANIKIDGIPDEAVWRETAPASQLVEWRPNFGEVEDNATRTEIFLLYDNTSVYVAGICYEKKDSVSRELVGRDQLGVNDYVGVIFDTYLDKINGVGFYVTPLGEQFDAKYSNANEDPSWNAVWSSKAKINGDNWTFEMRIPYSALRFVSRDYQTWGMNIMRSRKKAGRQFMWNPVDPKVSGLINQEGEWTNIEKIQAPVRLSFSPYFSTYMNHYPYKTNGVKDWTSSVNGGMDVKYGINNAFTLDMTVIPDFGQVRSDNQVLNLSPFEVKYNENRPFFTEGTELFNKGNLFYSRRIGGIPIHYGDVKGQLAPNEQIIKNPTESKLLNATKISGRTKNGLALGVFNAITKPMYASIEDNSGNKREIETGPLTNYNIIVFDQTFKNHSVISFINTNTWRRGNDYDANVSAALFDFNNKKNSFNWQGKFALSQIMKQGKKDLGYFHNLSIGKTGGRWNLQLGEEIADDKYNINDLGILFNSNYVDHYFWTAYRWLKSTSWYNRIQISYNAFYSFLYKKVPDQKIDSKFQVFRTNVNGNIQFKNLWRAGMFFGFIPRGNDFYEPRVKGYSFRSPQKIQMNFWFESNSIKKYYFSFNYFVAIRSLFNSPNHEFNFSHHYRFNDKFSIGEDINYYPAINDAGFYKKYYEPDPSGNAVLKDIIFSRRDRKTVENIISAKYNFNNKSGIIFRARHYWSKVKQKQLYDLQVDGTLTPTTHTITMEHQNFNIFNVDATFTWEFAQGSFVNIVWKNQATAFDGLVNTGYFKNFENTFSSPQNINLSFKIIYYLDYLDFKKWRKK